MTKSGIKPLRKNKLRFFVCFVVLVTLVLMIVGCGTFLSQIGITNFDYKIDINKGAVTITGIGTVNGIFIVIPETIDGYPVTAIDDYAFKNNDVIYSVDIPKTVEYIGQGAFYNCTNLTKVYNLEKCTALKSIERETFYNCKYLRNITLPNSVISIEEYAFKSCHFLKKMDIPSGVNYIGIRAFDNCQSIEEIVVPEGVDIIEEGTFFSCMKLKNISLPNGITEIADKAFANCYELETIELPSTLKTIGEDAFNTCRSLTELDIPNGVAAINRGTFIECDSLSRILIPASIVYIAYSAFDYCEALQDISIDKNNRVYFFEDGGIYRKENKVLVRYLMGKQDDVFTILDGIEVINDVALGGNPYLKVLNIPKSVKRINQYALYSSVMHTINYDGTVEEWQSIEKDPAWDKKTIDYTVYCTDGQIAKDGTVTYK